MNQIISIALGGAVGAILRFFVSTGVYHWFGRGFPYGTLAVNVIGSLLIGLMTEALILQRLAISMEYRAAILVGLFGSFTTFSTFSLDTLNLIEQGQILKAGLNVFVSVLACLLAVWLGLSLGRLLFSYSGGVIRWLDWVFPYAILFVNVIGALLIGMITQLLIHRFSLALEYRVSVLLILVGLFTTLSTLYVVLYLIEEGLSFQKDMSSLLLVLVGNASVCLAAVWGGMWLGRQIPA